MSPNTIRQARFLFTIVGSFLFLLPALRAQESTRDEPAGGDLEVSRPGASARGAARGTASAAKGAIPSVTSLTTGPGWTESQAGGYLKLHVNRKKHVILAEIPASRVGNPKRPFLLATSIVGGRYAGWQWDSLMVYWERRDKKLLLVEPEYRNLPGSDAALSDVVHRTYSDKIVTSVPILAQGRNSLVVDFTSLFGRRAGLFVGPLVRGVDPSLTKVAEAKSFPQNVEIELDLVRPRSGGGGSIFGLSGGGGGTVKVHYSLSALPATGYSPRAADDRIGYFLSAHKDFSKDSRDESRFVRYLNRWHLRKADPKLKLSPPKDPIVFYIEKTVPVRYRRYVRDGILEWNKAFEKVGILGAIEVRQQTAVNDFKDYDPEDVRYNFFRWITSEMAFAMGPSRVDPRTGQILDADIIFDDSMIRSWLGNYAAFIEAGPQREYHPTLRQYLDDFPHRHPMAKWRRPTPSAATTSVTADSLEQALNGTVFPGDYDLHSETKQHALGLSLNRQGVCEFGPGVRHQVNIGMLAYEWELGAAEKGGKTDEWPEAFVGQVLKEVVMHEVGHTLGLRHNFKASSWKSLDEMQEDGVEATSGSVMDYNPIRIGPEVGREGHYVTQTLGPYDFWAIEFGYTFDKKKLASIPKRVAEEGLAYGTDEDRWSSDPLVNAFDASKEPLEYASRRMQQVQRMLPGIVERVVSPGEGYQKARRAFDMLIYDYARNSWYMTRYVGGHYVHRDHKGDPDARPPVEPVPAHKQRKALKLVNEKMFGEKAFDFPPELLNYLAVGRWSHWGSRDTSGSPEYPIHDRILQLQLWTLFDFINPSTLSRVYDAELRLDPDEDALTVAELLETLTDAIFNELNKESGEYTNRKPLINSFRRNLQHEYVLNLGEIALEGTYGRSPQAARTQAWFRLRKLHESIQALLGRAQSGALKLDDYSQAHLEETTQRISKVLEASFTRNEAAPSGGGLIIIGQPAGSEE